MELEILSFSIGLFGLGFAIYEHVKRVRIETALRTQFGISLNRLRSLMTYDIDMNKLLEQVEAKEVISWAWANHKGLSDIYAFMVGYYLAGQSTFTYKDLKNHVDTGVIRTAWEEYVWRDAIAFRPENQGVKPPESFIRSDQARPTQLRGVPTPDDAEQGGRI
jgi:hypothetical protein